MHELELRGITKRFPGVLANDHVDLAVERGEIHALMGENGAGKSTLMSVLYGLTPPDEGEIYLRGERVQFASPIDAISAGLGMVFQSFKLFPSMTVAENIVYRQEPTRGLSVDMRAATNRIHDMCRKYGLDVDPRARVDQLPIGVLQLVEILKALYRRARVLILDEPTAVLTPQQTDALFDVLRALAADGKTIILITHKLKEVMAVADKVTVLRDGRVVADLVTGETSAAEITRYMTGRDVALKRYPRSGDIGKVLLAVDGLAALGDDRHEALRQVSLAIHAGEIVGIAGVAGNGQTELAEAIAGLRPSHGRVVIGDADVTSFTPARRRATGLSYVPEDRHEVGTIADASATVNLAAGYQRQAPISRRGFIDRSAMLSHALGLIRAFGIKIAGASTAVGTLSGGNLQKVVIARELSHGAAVLIAEQPTRGVDIGAIESIHEHLARYRDSGNAILLISAELSELMNLADRILVMFEGRVIAEVPAGAATEAELGLFMAGSAPHVTGGGT
jgi:simple sugar transport system ATP-binding protein